VGLKLEPEVQRAYANVRSATVLVVMAVVGHMIGMAVIPILVLVPRVAVPITVRVMVIAAAVVVAVVKASVGIPRSAVTIALVSVIAAISV
jgi:hypothetical protein